MRSRSLTVVYDLLLGLALIGTIVASRAEDWQPIGLVLGLCGLAMLSEVLVIETRTLRLSGSFMAIVLAMVLLGPAPAVAISLAAIALDAVRHPLPASLRLINASAYATFPLVGGLVVRWLELAALDGIAFGFAVAAVAAATNALNFLLIALPRLVTHGERFTEQLRTMFLPVLPAELVAIALAACTALVYRELGLSVLLTLVLVLVLFQVLTRELVRSQTRAEQLELRTQQLGALQIGVLAGFVQTLALRDKMTARHSAAVARYARAIAAEVGLDAEAQDLVHTAGLLHDLGKFAFPDSILLGREPLTEEQWELVRLHPEHGARLVRRVDGYGPVADIILAHHERMDGTGYPYGLPGEQVPVLSRIISIADAYDVMTARDSYQEAITRGEAVAALRGAAGTQLDGELVEVFVRVLAHRGLDFQHTTDADFEAELRFEARVRDVAAAPSRIQMTV